MVLHNVKCPAKAINTFASRPPFQSVRHFSPSFQGWGDAEIKQAEFDRMDHFREICRREKEALTLFVDLLEQKLEDSQVNVSVENRNESKSIRFHISPPFEELARRGLTSGIELGLSFEGTTLPFGFGKPVVKIFGFFNTLANPKAKKSQEPSETISHTGAFKLNYKAGKPFNPQVFKPYHNPVDRLGGFIKQIKGETSYLDEIGRSFENPKLDARQVKLMIRLLEKTQMMPELDKMIQRVKRKLKDSL